MSTENIVIKVTAEDRASNVMDKIRQSYTMITTKTQEYNNILGRTMNVTDKFNTLNQQNVRTWSDVNSSVNSNSKSINILNSDYIKFALSLVGVQAGLGFIKQIINDMIETINKGIQSYRDFDKSVAQISTTLQGAEITYLPMFTQEVQKLSIQFGKSVTDISKGLYDILSAATPVEDAINLLTISLKNAVAGLTDTETSVKIMIDVMNAWGYSVEQMQHVSDVLFASVLRGTYTFDELESAIGYVAPIASEAGVSLEEISAAMASATRRGMHLDSVTRGLSQIITSIINPTKEAAETAVQYGIMLGSAGLATKGFSGLLNEINEAIGDNDEAIVKIFANVRSYRVIMGLAGEGIEAFNEDLKLMTDSVGMMEQAFQKMTSTAQMMSDVITQATEYVARGLGENTNEIALFWQRLEKTKTEMYKSLTERKGTYFIGEGEIELGEIFSIDYQLFGKTVAQKSGQAIYDQFSSYMDTYAGGITEKINKMYTDAINNATINIGVEEQTPFTKLMEGNKPSDVFSTDLINNTKGYIGQLGVVNEKQKEYIKLLYLTPNATQVQIDTAALVLKVESDKLSALQIDYNSYKGTIDDANSAVEYHNDAIIDLSRSMSDLKLEIGDIGNLYDGTLGIQLELAESTEKLRLAEKGYTSAIKENNLALMQLQLMGMMRRGGNTRAEQRMMKQIQIENLSLRIQQEQETAGLEKQKEKAVDEANRAELESTKNLINSKEASYNEMSVSIQKHYRDMINAQSIALTLAIGLFGKESVEVINMINYYNKLNRARAGEIVDVTGYATPTNLSYAVPTPIGEQKPGERAWKKFQERTGLPGLQHGIDYVPYTAPYLLHKGEKVIPSGKNIANNNNITINVPIKISNIKSDIDLNNLAGKIGLAVKAQLMNTDGTSKYNLR